MAEKRMIEANCLWSDIMMLPHNGDMISSEEVEQAIMDSQTVDAVEVVRCRDCKNYCNDKGHGMICRHPELDWDVECYDLWINTKPDDFCSYGERKEGADNG